MLHREAEVDEVARGADVHRLQVVQQRAAVVPRHPLALVHHVVAEERAHRDEGEIRHLELLGELAVLGQACAFGTGQRRRVRPGPPGSAPGRAVEAGFGILSTSHYREVADLLGLSAWAPKNASARDDRGLTRH